MKIPCSFQLMGQTINVIMDDTLLAEHDGYGVACFRKNEIRIMPSSPAYPRSEEQLTQTFYHELMHYILFFAAAKYKQTTDSLHEDEVLVDLCANLLHQAYKTMEYEDGSRRPSKSPKKN